MASGARPICAGCAHLTVRPRALSHSAQARSHGCGDALGRTEGVLSGWPLTNTDQE